MKLFLGKLELSLYSFLSHFEMSSVMCLGSVGNIVILSIF